MDYEQVAQRMQANVCTGFERHPQGASYHGFTCPTCGTRVITGVGDGPLADIEAAIAAAVDGERERQAKANAEVLDVLIRCHQSLKTMLKNHGSPWKADWLAAEDAGKILNQDPNSHG